MPAQQDHAANILFAFAAGASAVDGREINLDRPAHVGSAPDQLKLSAVLRAMRFKMELGTFPTAKKCLDRLMSLQWPLTVALPQKNPTLDTTEYREFPSFAAYYEAEIEPWLGKWEELCEVYERYIAGQVSQQAGADLLRQSKDRSQAAALATTGEVLPAHRPSDEVGNLPTYGQATRATAAGISHRQQRKLDALARERPDLLKQVQEGHKSVHAASIEAGIVQATFPVPVDVAAAAAVLRRRFKDQLPELIRLLLD